MLHEASDLSQLKTAIERKIKATLSVTASVEMVPAGTLPRYEMKGQLINRTYEAALRDAVPSTSR